MLQNEKPPPPPPPPEKPARTKRKRTGTKRGTQSSSRDADEQRMSGKYDDNDDDDDVEEINASQWARSMGLHAEPAVKNEDIERAWLSEGEDDLEFVLVKPEVDVLEDVDMTEVPNVFD